MTDEKKKFGVGPTIQSLRRLMVHMKGLKARFISGLAIYSFAGEFAFNLLFSLSFLLVLGAGETRDMAMFYRGLIFTSIGFIVVVVLLTAGQLLYDIAVARASGELRKKVFNHFNRLPVRWYEDNHSGEAASLLTVDIQEAEKAWGVPLRGVMGILLSGIGSVVVMFILDWKFSLIIIPVGILMFFATTRFIEPVRKKSNDVQATHGELTKQLIDLLASSRIVRIFNMSGWLGATLEKSIDKVFQHSMKRAHLVTAQEGVNSIASMFTAMGSILIGSFFVIEGSLSVAKLVAMVQMSNGINSMFYQLGARLTALQTSLAGAERVLDVLDIPSEEKKMPVYNTADSVVALRDASFSYNNTAQVLQDLSLDIRKGETLAIVGGSGGGKSTLLKIISQFYAPSDGEIAFAEDFGKDTESIRSNIAYVPQSNYLFSGTIKENILFGRPDADESEVIEAARAARAHEFILDLPEGYDTMVGERGSQLSGGQRQRISIARALLKNADLLLFDEATSSLDSRSEKLVQDAIDGMIQNRTSVIVAHRLSTVQHADRIIVLEDGQVVEEGDHQTLLDNNGRYAYYYEMQLA